MNTQEILPEPETEKSSENLDNLSSRESVNETEANKQVEKSSQGGGPGSGVVSAVAVDDAQQQVMGATGASSIGATSTKSITDIDVPEIADDIELIEKAWVQKAKEIVNATQGDPHAQNNQINKMKVDYIKKRYNKDIKYKED